MKNNKEKVLVFRTGSLGDTIVAIPAFNLVRKKFKNAEIKVLTNFPVGYGDKEATLQAVLGKSTLINGYYNYSAKKGSLKGLLDLAQEIREWGVTHLIYIMPVRTRFMILRDWIFFKYIVKVPTIFGLSFLRDRQEHLYNQKTNLYEAESERILRNIKDLGNIELHQDAFNPDIHSSETIGLMQKVSMLNQKDNYIVCSIGTKWDSKDWGKGRWLELFKRISVLYPNLGLIMIGSKEEYLDSNSVIQSWKGPSQNLCGMLTVRESAEVLKSAYCYFGHDSGPMHLAYSVKTPCVAVFSAQGKPGVWFPFGSKHKILYHKTECFGCELEYCSQHHKKCINSISVSEVFYASIELLKEVCAE